MRVGVLFLAPNVLRAQPHEGSVTSAVIQCARRRMRMNIEESNTRACTCTSLTCTSLSTEQSACTCTSLSTEQTYVSCCSRPCVPNAHEEHERLTNMLHTLLKVGSPREEIAPLCRGEARLRVPVLGHRRNGRVRREPLAPLTRELQRQSLLRVLCVRTCVCMRKVMLIWLWARALRRCGTQLQAAPVANELASPSNKLCIYA